MTSLDIKAPTWKILEHYEHSQPVEVSGDQFEELWLPVVGTSVVAFMRHCARNFRDGKFTTEPVELAYRLNLSGGQNRRSPLLHTITQAQRFEMLHILSPTSFAVSTSVETPRLLETRRQAMRAEWRQSVGGGLV